MIERNAAFSKLTAGYLFPEIAKRKASYAKNNPSKKIISLGIGNTTEPLSPHIAGAMARYIKDLQTNEGYSGYGDEQGLKELRSKIVEVLYPGLVSEDEVFVSDGAKCDIGRLQVLFGSNVSVAVQDPAYPVYVDGSVIAGVTGSAKEDGSGYDGISYMPCTDKNAFFPHLSHIKKNSLIYFCSPNNPTGATATKEQLLRLVTFAQDNGCIIIFDAAYSAFIQDESLPKTIFEIEGAKKCAIEINSFSKPIGFTGVRLGWSIVPKELQFADGSSVNKDWNRVMTTIFNGASNIAQRGGLAALDQKGLAETKCFIQYYLKNEELIKEALLSENFKKLSIEIYGDGNSPYLWVKFPQKKSWDVFDEILQQCQIVTTPGVGFGPAGESFIRFSSFGHRDDIIEACKRLKSFSL